MKAFAIAFGAMTLAALPVHAERYYDCDPTTYAYSGVEYREHWGAVCNHVFGDARVVAVPARGTVYNVPPMVVVTPHPHTSLVPW